MGHLKTIIVDQDFSFDMALDCLFQEICGISSGDPVVFDMGKVKAATVRDIPVLITITYLAYERSRQPVKLSNVTSKVMCYLMQINFWSLPYISRISHRELLRPQMKTYGKIILPIKRISTYDELCDVSMEYRGRQSNNDSIRYSQKADLLKLLNTLGENSLEHSSAVINKDGKFYAFIEEDEDRIVMVVLDMGVGFYHSLSNKYPSLTTDSEAVCGVLMKHITSRINGTGGAGFYTVENLLAKYKGKIMIRSGNAVIYYESGHVSKKIATKESVKGSCILIELDKI